MKKEEFEITFEEFIEKVKSGYYDSVKFEKFFTKNHIISKALTFEENEENIKRLNEEIKKRNRLKGEDQKLEQENFYEDLVSVLEYNLGIDYPSSNRIVKYVINIKDDYGFYVLPEEVRKYKTKDDKIKLVEAIRKEIKIIEAMLFTKD